MYIISAYRTAVGKAQKGVFKTQRADHLAPKVIQHILQQNPQIEKTAIDDLIVGCAMPEAEQGLNVARFISLMSFGSEKISAMTVNRYCASGLESIAIASAKIKAGQADCIIAGGVETMSPIPMGGWRIVPNVETSQQHPDWYWGMGLTAEAVAEQFQISRNDSDAFALQSHQKATKAIEEKKFAQEIVPIEVEETLIEKSTLVTKKKLIDTDEGPRQDTSLEALSGLKPVFSAKGTVTAGNSSQTSDGAAFVMVASEAFVKKHNLKPIAFFHHYATAGVEPKIMGIGPVEAIPKVLQKAGKKLQDIDLIELNEAFACQALAVMNELKMDKEKVNVNGGAIALGHPLGCTGTKLSVQIIHELQRRKKKYGMVTMCVGTGQGAAGIIEVLN